jgi:hypothetical protein
MSKTSMTIQAIEGQVLNTKNARGETALHIVPRSGHNLQYGVCVAWLLLESGADVNTQDKDHNSQSITSCILQ